MEQIDIFTEMFEPTGKTADIDTVHRQGLWHQSFACWLVHLKSQSVYLQLRGPKNRVGPNTLDATASGHLSAKENPKDGFRELTEELGIGYDDLINPVYLGINKNIFLTNTYLNREFCHVFMAKTDLDLSDFSLQPGEVQGIFSLKINEAICLFDNKKQTVLCHGLILNNGLYEGVNRQITLTDFCNYRDRTLISGYYLKIMMTADHYLKEQPPYRI